MTDTPLPTDTKYKAVDFIETHTGKQFFIQDPQPEQISIIDIAHALSNQCRYSGHTLRFYSVAQHCCLLASYAAERLGASALDCLQMLMHDGAEAYLIDMPRPIKKFLPDFRKLDYQVNQTIRKWYGVEHMPMPSFQDELDSRAIVDERAVLMTDSGNDWNHNLEPLGITIEPWGPERAEYEFLLRYAAYSYGAFGQHAYYRDMWGMPNAVRFTAASSDQEDGVTDLLEVDLLGGVGRVKVRDENGMLERDRSEPMPRYKWKFIHGKFDVLTPLGDNQLEKGAADARAS